MLTAMQIVSVERRRLTITLMYGIITAEKEFLPMQPGDVYQTYADVDDLVRDFDFKPNTSLKEGLSRFAKWYKEFYVKD